MKKKYFFLSAFLIASLLFLLQPWSTTIDVSNYPTPQFITSKKSLDQSTKFSMSLIETGFAETPEAFVFKGGSLFKNRRLSHVAILIQHPKGNFVFDTGLGSEIESQFHEHFSFLDRQMFKFTKLASLKETLIKNSFHPDSINFIIPSHLHFDHASGIEDFPKATVWTTTEEYNHAISEKATLPAFIKEQYDADFIKWKFMSFSNTPYEIYKESYDVFNDGSVVLVKLPGHTMGSLGMFVNLNSGKRYFFTGDLTWAAEAFMSPSEKHFIPSKKVDYNKELVKESIVGVYHLKKQRPLLHIIPAHDYNAQKNIPRFPDVAW